jgi:hypothetical protein
MKLRQIGNIGLPLLTASVVGKLSDVHEQLARLFGDAPQALGKIA